MIKELKDIALDIFGFASQRQVYLDINRLPRDQSSQADFFSKIVDFYDCSVHDEAFFRLEEP